ncbi:MAG: glycosyltransferase family 2 protein [Deltaproteobacteria bacterium]|nr:glycosyltransferase family 2 protein [Deltaproteobacteria bacterium]
MHREMPTVTVVVPAYNHEDYVADCIKSILGQDYPDIDLIVINDGSTDSTDLRIREWMKENKCSFRYVSKQNEGLIKTLNLGLGMSKGEYFCECASDDMMLPGSIRKRVEYLQANPVLDCVFADGYLIEGAAKTEKRLFKDNGKTGFRSSEHSIEDILSGRARIFFASGMIKRSVIDALGAFDEAFRYHEDWLLKYQIVIRGRVGYLDEPVMYYRVHSTNTSRGNPLWVREENILALEKLIAAHGEPLRGLLKQYLFREYLKYLKVGRKNRVDRDRLMEELKKAVKIRRYSLRVLCNFISLVFYGGGGSKGEVDVHENETR